MSFKHLKKDHFKPSKFHRADIVDQPLHCICPVFNPIRFRKRWKEYEDFQEYVLQNNEAYLYTIEANFGERAFVISKQVGARHTVIQVNMKYEAWIKENLINIAISRLPLDWKYVCWLDGDITFARPDWVGECVHKLQHYDWLQMFTQAHDMDVSYNISKSFRSFMWCYEHRDIVPPPHRRDYITTQGKDQIGYWHPGFAWAARREAVDAVGGLIDWGILGGGDTFMAYALLGMLGERTMPRSLGPSGIRMLKQWQDRAEKYIKRNVGFMEGAVLHHFHGDRSARGYKDRGQVLVDGKFDPEVHLKKDAQGVWSMQDIPISVRDGIRTYFRMRNEDSPF